MLRSMFSVLLLCLFAVPVAGGTVPALHRDGGVAELTRALLAPAPSGVEVFAAHLVPAPGDVTAPLSDAALAARGDAPVFPARATPSAPRAGTPLAALLERAGQRAQAGPLSGAFATGGAFPSAPEEPAPRLARASLPPPALLLGSALAGLGVFGALRRAPG